MASKSMGNGNGKPTWKSPKKGQKSAARIEKSQSDSNRHVTTEDTPGPIISGPGKGNKNVPHPPTSVQPTPTGPEQEPSGADVSLPASLNLQSSFPGQLDVYVGEPITGSALTTTLVPSGPTSGELAARDVNGRARSPTRKRKSDQLAKSLQPALVRESPKRTRTTSFEARPIPLESAPIPEEDKPTAIFRNGMRQTSGRGRMLNDYIGMVLPLIDEFADDGTKNFGAPWVLDPHRFDYILGGTDRLHEEINLFLLYMARSPMEIKGRSFCTERAAQTITSFFGAPGHIARLYGSDATGMGLPTCDIDLMIKAPSLEGNNPYAMRDEKITSLRRIGNLFQTSGISSSANVRDGAAVPLLEVTDAASGLEIDISFEEHQAAQSLSEIEHWKRVYGEEQVVKLVLLLKHALGMRKLGYGTALMPYQGGVGSYVLLCMVVCYLDSLHKSSQQFGIWDPCNPYNANIGGLFLGLLKFWGHDFNHETSGLLLEPPCIYPKSLGLPPYIFEVRRKLGGSNLAGATFGTRHIKETLGYFYSELAAKVCAYTDWKQDGGWDNAPVDPRIGILGSILAGNYSSFHARREKVMQVGRAEESRKYIPPHLRRREPPP